MLVRVLMPMILLIDLRMNVEEQGMDCVKDMGRKEGTGVTTSNREVLKNKACSSIQK